MSAWWILIAELLIIFFTSKHISNALYNVFFGLSRSRVVSSYLLFAVFFPGVLVHELGHYIMARILFVPVHEFNLIPRHEEDSVRLGSVLISKSDPLRRFLIGVAPVVIGIIVLYMVVRFGVGSLSVASLPEHWVAWAISSYIIFVTANTMFSSKRDMEGAVFLLLILLALLGVGYFIGVPLVSVLKQLIKAEITTQLVNVLTRLLLIPAGINILLFILVQAFRRGRASG